MTGRAERGDAGLGEPLDIEQFARVLGHELGETAALLDGYLELLAQSPASAADGLRAATARIRDIYEALLVLSRVGAEPTRRTATDPARAVAAAGRSLQDTEIDVHPLPRVMADPDHLEQLFFQVLRTATDPAASKRRQPVVIHGSRVGPDVHLDIGVPRSLAPAPLRGRDLVGHGIGLTISDHIAARNGGRLCVSGGATTTISLTLPAAEG